MAVQTATGGALEAVYSALSIGGTVVYNECTVFTVMSNECNTPKILFCPADNGTWKVGGVDVLRAAATNWATFDWTLTGNTPASYQFLSYFVCGDAFESYPQMILTGDRNIGTAPAGSPAPNTNATSITATQWGPAPTPIWAWDQASLHLKNGNLGLADGSVQQATISGLQSALTAATNGEPNLYPYYNFPQ